MKTLYIIKDTNGRLLYIGKNTGKHSRPKAHLSRRRHILRHYQQVDIALALLPLRDIVIDVIKVSEHQDLDHLETSLIKSMTPEFNTMHHTKYQCHCGKEYQSLSLFDGHQSQCTK